MHRHPSASPREALRSLYISHIGMTEPLGQSQVLPYLAGLASRGIQIEILSYEPPDVRADAIEALATRLAKQGLAWRPTVRSKSHSLATKVWESGIGVARGLALALRRRPHVVHARSYLPTAVADMITTLAPGAKLLFDCRGMLGDEYVEAGHWTKESVQYRLLKTFERRAFRRTDGLVVLTDALASWLRDERLLGAHTEVAVVPCCVDTARFRPDAEARAQARRELGVEDRLVVVYSGSLGGWYCEQEMARLVGMLKQRAPNVAFVVLSRYATDGFRAAARAAGLSDADVIVRSVPSADMPRVLAAGDLGLSLIQPCFSKTGSSPTKVAEYLAAGMPVVVNAGVGDQGALVAEPDACVVVDEHDATASRSASPPSDAALARAVDPALALARRDWATRSAETYRVARARFSLADLGVPRYEALYRALGRPR